MHSLSARAPGASTGAARVNRINLILVACGLRPLARSNNGGDTMAASRTFEGQPMKNVEMSVEGNILIIKVDLSKEYGPSSSGKTIIVASTEGNVSIRDHEEKLGLNVYRKK